MYATQNKTLAVIFPLHIFTMPVSALPKVDQTQQARPRRRTRAAPVENIIPRSPLALLVPLDLFLFFSFARD